MLKLIICLLAFLHLYAPIALSQKRETPPSKVELAGITERGRQLAEYDVAAWHSADAVRALSPPEGSVERYVAKKTGAGWIVAFGRLDEQRGKFLVVYEAAQGPRPEEFKVMRHDPPKESADFYFFAARAINTALADFRGEQRPYNVAVLPAKSGQWYVYVVPAQTRHDVYPHGGDVRYLVSSEASKIVERRQLHRSILEFQISEKMEAGFHTAVVDNVPEDTDVFYVLSRKPRAPELIGTEKFVYKVEADGTINYLMTVEAFKKIK